jgi:hypothetical protein
MHKFLKLGKLVFLLLLVIQVKAQRVFIVVDTFNFSKKSYLKANQISYKKVMPPIFTLQKLNEFPQSANLAMKANNTYYQGIIIYLFGGLMSYYFYRVDDLRYSQNYRRREINTTIPLVLGAGAAIPFFIRSIKIRKKAYKTYNFYKNNLNTTK